jgi:nuclear distribution protein NudE
MSPSMIPRPSSSMMHTFSGADHNIHTITASSSTPTSRPDSRSAHRVLGRGPPPKVFPGSQGVKSSTSTSTASNPALRKSARRSSIGTAEARANSGLPQPRNPSRPVSVSVLEGTPPPPVPRIPSMHLRESKRGHEQLDRRRSLLHR